MQASLSVDIIWPIPHVKHCSGGFAEEPQSGIEVGAVDGGGDDASTVCNTQYSTHIDHPRLHAVFAMWIHGLLYLSDSIHNPVSFTMLYALSL